MILRGFNMVYKVDSYRQPAETGDVPFLTEYGATGDLATIERLVRLSDAHMVSWQYWHICTGQLG